MDSNINTLRTLIEKLRNISFFKRLFGWGEIRDLLIDANSEIQNVVSVNEILKANNQKLESGSALTSKDVENLNSRNIQMSSELVSYKERLNHITPSFDEANKKLAAFEETNRNFQDNITELKTSLAATEQKFLNANQELKKLSERNIQLERDEESRKQIHSNDVSTLNKIREQIEQNRAKEIEDRNNLEIDRLKKLKDTWVNHEDSVQSRIKNIASKHTIEYVAKVPFKGSPDNTLRLCDEFVIFDSKSPQGDDLSNFPTYIKTQAEAAKKYAKQEGVKTDIFFVVPSNTLDKIPNFTFNMSDYNLFVISIDALEPIILGLKKIEAYEFTDQLSPEERENICRVIGKFTHMTKRRIQIDNYFATQFIELGYKCESDLPKEIFDEVLKFETQDKLNPPQEKRAKVINLKMLETDTQKIKSDMGTKGVSIEDDMIVQTLNELPLYKVESN